MVSTRVIYIKYYITLVIYKPRTHARTRNTRTHARTRYSYRIISCSRCSRERLGS
nr:hypothetical protein GSWITJQO_GSWITJQO_CDS_0006 [Microvirus sp.]CAI9752508.1 hypothetical protein XTAFSSYH_XTAFSSYH_CDS_0006 [Microvirus sp.]